MKFWQKVFICVLLIFVVAFNIGMFIVMHFTYKEQLNSVRQRARNESYILRTSMSKDFASIEKSKTLTSDKKESIYDSYALYYEKQNVYVELWNGNKKIGDGYDFKFIKDFEIEDLTQVLWFQNWRGQKCLFIACPLEIPYEKNIMIIAYPLKELLEVRQALIRLVIGVDIAITIILALLLYIILRRLMMPLRYLADATQSIAKGDYNRKIQVSSHDEFELLAEKFNSMTDEIRDKIQLLEIESNQKQELIDNLAHELRTPLTSIYGYADYMSMAQLSEEERIQSLTYIKSESKRLEKLSKTLLLLADIREATLARNVVITKNLEEYIQNLFFGQMKEKNIQIIFEREVESIKVNEELVHILLGNLVENAIRACLEQGKITITITQLTKPCIIVQDTGIGMQEEDMKRIVEPFYRVDKARSRKNGGVGLGVTLCHKIVAAHGGDIHYESIVGSGTKVTVTL